MIRWCNIPVEIRLGKDVHHFAIIHEYNLLVIGGSKEIRRKLSLICTRFPYGQNELNKAFDLILFPPLSLCPQKSRLWLGNELLRAYRLIDIPNDSCPIIFAKIIPFQKIFYLVFFDILFCLSYLCDCLSLVKIRKIG